MPNTLTEKAIAQPFRVGLMLGALVLPSLWVLSQDALRVLTSQSLLNSEEITTLFAIGFLPGMALGAGTVQAWAAWRAGKTNSVRWLLIGYGCFVTVIDLIVGPTLLVSHSPLAYLLARPPQNWDSRLANEAFLFYADFPLQFALAMFLVGLFMRGKNA